MSAAASELHTTGQVKAALVAACDHLGGQRAFARRTGLPHSLVSQTLSGEREVGAAIANALGFATALRFVQLRPPWWGTGTTPDDRQWRALTGQRPAPTPCLESPPCRTA